MVIFLCFLYLSVNQGDASFLNFYGQFSDVGNTWFSCERPMFHLPKHGLLPLKRPCFEHQKTVFWQVKYRSFANRRRKIHHQSSRHQTKNVFFQEKNTTFLLAKI